MLRGRSDREKGVSKPYKLNPSKTLHPRTKCRTQEMKGISSLRRSTIHPLDTKVTGNELALAAWKSGSLEGCENPIPKLLTKKNVPALHPCTVD